MLDVISIKKDFPIFEKHPTLVYLDSGATSLKPKRMIDKLLEYYREYSANVFRGIYDISEKATEEYESTRNVIALFINANSAEEVIFTRNTSESMNLVMYSLGRGIIDEQSEVVTTIMEHHSNFVPWQQLAFENNAIFKVIEVNEDGTLKNIDKLDQIITKNTKLLALTYVSNVLGTINPIKQITADAKKINPNIIVIVDAAQAVPHFKVDVKDLGCDFLAFSSHKMFGPTGVGVLWGKLEILEKMYPYQYGGEMIEEVTLEKTTFKKSPHKYEAGTPHIAGVIALKEAVHYLESVGFDAIRTHEKELVAYGIEQLEKEFGDSISIFGPRNLEVRGGVIAFTFNKIHPHDIAQVLNESNIAIRAGHHCAQPLHTYLNVPSTARATFHIYNSKEDVDALIAGLKKVTSVFA